MRDVVRPGRPEAVTAIGVGRTILEKLEGVTSDLRSLASYGGNLSVRMLSVPFPEWIPTLGLHVNAEVEDLLAASFGPARAAVLNRCPTMVFPPPPPGSATACQFSAGTSVDTFTYGGERGDNLFCSSRVGKRFGAIQSAAHPSGIDPLGTNRCNYFLTRVPSFHKV